MNFIKQNKKTFLLVLVFLGLLSFYFIRGYIASKTTYIESYLDGKDYIMAPKTYGVNEYSPINITDEQMANIYLNDFKYVMYNDINGAYNLLNQEYRDIKFGNITNFINYVNSLGNITIDRYSVSSGNSVYTIYTTDGKTYIFKVKSVMEYEVYLDDYTVEI